MTRKIRSYDYRTKRSYGVFTLIVWSFYRPKTKLREGNVFTPVCHSVHRAGGVYLSACWDTHTPGQTPLGKHPTGQTHTPGRTRPPGRHPPPAVTAADGTHPTGMHSCSYCTETDSMGNLQNFIGLGLGIGISLGHCQCEHTLRE